jgi:phage-related protein
MAKEIMRKRFLREVYYFKDYYLKFYNTLNTDVQTKFNWTIQLIATIERVPSKYFEYISNSDGIFEIRVEYNSNIYRVFCFFDEGNIIILVNGFQKKSQKTPKNELTRAEKLKQEYFYEKTIK